MFRQYRLLNNVQYKLFCYQELEGQRHSNQAIYRDKLIALNQIKEAAEQEKEKEMEQFKEKLEKVRTFKADSRFAPSQWEALLCNGVFNWLGASLESALDVGTSYNNIMSPKYSLRHSIAPL